MCVCVCVCVRGVGDTCHSVYVEVRGHHVGAGSPFLLCEFRNSGCQLGRKPLYLSRHLSAPQTTILITFKHSSKLWGISKWLCTQPPGYFSSCKTEALF